MGSIFSELSSDCGGDMDFLGVVEEVTTDRRLIVAGVTTPEPGDRVFDSKQKHIGSVKRVFGPVDGPYVSIVPVNITILSNINGKKVYFEGATTHGKNKRRN